MQDYVERLTRARIAALPGVAASHVVGLPDPVRGQVVVAAVVPAADIALRCLLAAVSFLVMFHPDMKTSAAVSMVVLAAICFGIMQHRRIAPPKSVASDSAKSAVTDAGELAPVLAEAKREIG